MSSKIISGPAARLAVPIAWERRDGGVVTEAAGTAATGSGIFRSVDVTALEARLRQIQAEQTVREAQARKAGFDEGQGTARKALEASYRDAMARLASEVAGLSVFRRRFRRQAEEDLVRLAIAIARRVLRRELSTDPEAILGLVKAAMERIDARDVFRVRVHPEDARVLEASLADLGLPERIEIAADRNLERGAMVIETVRGELDGSVETQLAEIERGFADLVRRHP